jgi:hypothetical protein
MLAVGSASTADVSAREAGEALRSGTKSLNFISSAGPLDRKYTITLRRTA